MINIKNLIVIRNSMILVFFILLLFFLEIIYLKMYIEFGDIINLFHAIIIIYSLISCHYNF